MLSFVPHQPELSDLISPSEAIAEVWDRLPANEDAEQRYTTAKREVFSALRRGALTAYAHAIAAGSFYRIPVDYWKPGDFWDFRLSDQLSTFDETGVPSALEDSSVLLVRRELESLPLATDDDPQPAKRGRTAPGWVELLEMEFLEACAVRDNWHETHPNKPIPPQFPNATRFRARLLNKYSRLKSEQPPLRTVRYHVARLRKKYGR